MTWEKPSPATVWQAIEIYLAAAYPVPPSGSAASRIASLRDMPPEHFFQCPSFERTPKEEPIRLELRLGNCFYPHMKMVIEAAPDQRGHLFRADTHDRHIQPSPGSRDYAAFKELMEKNVAIASRIEAAWEEAGICTFKAYLRQDLARRRNAASG